MRFIPIYHSRKCGSVRLVSVGGSKSKLERIGGSEGEAGEGDKREDGTYVCISRRV